MSELAVVHRQNRRAVRQFWLFGASPAERSVMFARSTTCGATFRYTEPLDTMPEAEFDSIAREEIPLVVARDNGELFVLCLECLGEI